MHAISFNKVHMAFWKLKDLNLNTCMQYINQVRRNFDIALSPTFTPPDLHQICSSFSLPLSEFHIATMSFGTSTRPEVGFGVQILRTFSLSARVKVLTVMIMGSSVTSSSLLVGDSFPAAAGTGDVGAARLPSGSCGTLAVGGSAGWDFNQITHHMRCRFANATNSMNHILIYRVYVSLQTYLDMAHVALHRAVLHHHHGRGPHSLPAWGPWDM